MTDHQIISKWLINNKLDIKNVDGLLYYWRADELSDLGVLELAERLECDHTIGAIAKDFVATINDPVEGPKLLILLHKYA